MHGRSAVDWQQRVADPDAPRPVGLEVYAVQADGRIAASAFRAVQDGAQPERGTVISVRTTDLPMSTELSRLRSELTARRKLGMPGTVTTLLLDSDLVVCRILAAGSDSALEPWRLVGRPVIRAVHPQDRSRARDAMVRAWSAPGTVVSVSVRTQSSMIPSVIDRVDLLLRAEPDDPYLHGLVCHVVASTARRAAGAGADVSVRDPLTGLSTWAGLRMEEDGDVAGAAVIIDIVGLDQLNEDLGYEAGDAVVLATAERLGTLVDPRRIARLGGGRFVIVGPYGGSPRRLQALARRVLRTTALPVGYLTHHIPVEVVIGTAAADTDGLNGLLQRAGLSLNMFRLSMDDEPQAYGPELTTETLTRARLVLGLRDIDYDAELSVAYQPIIELATGRQVGREALLRWTHPQLGPIGPDVFIPLAESMGTIGALGSWELHRACRDAAAWADDGAKALSLSINVSPRQLSWIGFADEVQAALAGSGLGAHRLVLEVTETAVLDQSDSSIRNLDQLARMGHPDLVGRLRHRFLLALAAAPAAHPRVEDRPIVRRGPWRARPQHGHRRHRDRPCPRSRCHRGGRGHRDPRPAAAADRSRL